MAHQLSGHRIAQYHNIESAVAASLENFPDDLLEYCQVNDKSWPNNVFSVPRFRQLIMLLRDLPNIITLIDG